MESERFGGRLQIETPLFNQGAASLLWGVDYFNEDTVQPVTTFDRATFDASRGLVFRSTGERTWTPPLELNSLGLFAQLNWNVSDRWIVNGGVRYENADVSVDDFTTLANPNTVISGGDLDFEATLFNVGTVYFLTDELNVFANFAQGFSLADIGLVLRTASPEFSVETLRPEPQKVNSYEIGIRGAWDAVQASLAAFYNESDLGTTFTAPGTVIRDPERVYGIEAAIDAQLSDRWQLGGTLALIGGEIDRGDDGDYEPLDGFRIPPLKISAYIENETLPGWRNRLQALLSGDRDVFGDTIAFGRRPVESYLVVDYISSIRIGSGTLQLGIENLFDNQYFPVVSQLQINDTAYSAAMTIAETVNRRDAGKKVLQQMQETFENATAQLRSIGKVGSPFILGYFEETAPQLRLYTDNAMAVQILSQIGLENVWKGELDSFGFNRVWVEAMLAVEQANFLYSAVKNNVYLQQLQNNPIWKRLEFVQENRVYPIGGDTWLLGGPLSAQVLVKKVVASMTLPIP